MSDIERYTLAAEEYNGADVSVQREDMEPWLIKY